MVTIYLDESGDLGFSFNRNSSRYFVITLFETSLSIKELNKIIKITKERTIKKKEERKYEIKGSCKHTSNQTKKFLIKSVLEKDKNMKIIGIIVNKENIYDDLRDKKRVFYNYICKEILKNTKSNEINLILDRRDKKKSFITELNTYLETHFCNQNLIISHESSNEFAGLQIVDVFANSIFRNYERAEVELFEMIEYKLDIKKYFF